MGECRQLRMCYIMYIGVLLQLGGGGGAQTGEAVIYQAQWCSMTRQSQVDRGD